MIELKPGYTEALEPARDALFLQKDYGHALADLREVLLQEPRHFGALSGIGLILQRSATTNTHSKLIAGRWLSIPTSTTSATS